MHHNIKLILKLKTKKNNQILSEKIIKPPCKLSLLSVAWLAEEKEFFLKENIDVVCELATKEEMS